MSGAAAPPLPRAPAPAAKPARKRARLWWNVHQWAGLKLSLFLAVILFTGTLATVGNEVDWLLRPALRVDPAGATGPVAWARIARNAAAQPGIAAVERIDAPVAAAFAAKVTVHRRNGQRGFLFAHPATGAIQGAGPWADAHRVLRNMHRHLNLPTQYGVPIVAALAPLLLASLATAFTVYKKWWRGFAKPLRRRDARTWWGDLHRLVGVWSLWFVALIGVTGTWYLLESLGLDAPDLPEPVVEPRRDTATPPATPPADLAPDLAPDLTPDLTGAFAAARAAYPGLRVRAAILPGPHSALLELHGDAAAMLVRPRANAVWIDPRTTRAVMASDGRDLTPHQRIGEMADPLHFGTFGGYWTKIAWVIFGLALTVLAVSGAAIHGLRIVRDRRAAIRAQPVWRGMWAGMGAARWPCAALIAVGAVLLAALALGFDMA